jgi:MFS family permease
LRQLGLGEARRDVLRGIPVSTGVLIYTYGYSAAAAGAAFPPFSAIMAAGSRTAEGLAQRIGSRAMLAAGSLVTASGYAVFALSGERPEYWLGFLPGLVLTGIGMTSCVAPLTTVVLDAAPCDLGGSASGMNNAAARLGGARRGRRVDGTGLARQ